MTTETFLGKSAEELPKSARSLAESFANFTAELDNANITHGDVSLVCSASPFSH